ncbi:jg8932 [Pararge aegeria aegeria]|uniref:Jg8932 protein n=1 Tax=Pararge aegeria aegeria TaxID=348720 RepID=A0A8S4SL58_9NEOP|nr:jg8932 [Pararge aegeria aegeria]
MPTKTDNNRHSKGGFVFRSPTSLYNWYRYPLGYLYKFRRLILKGKITGKRAPGRQKNKWFDNIIEWTRHTYLELKKMAHHRTIFHRLTSELQDVIANDYNRCLILSHPEKRA